MPAVIRYKKNRYDAIAPLIYSGDLIEWQGTGLIARMIRIITKKRVNHSSLVLRIDTQELTDRRFIIEAMASGLELNLLSRRIAQYKGHAWWYGLKEHCDNRRDAIAGWALCRMAEGVFYDYDGVFRQLFARVSVDAKRFFCSEFYQAALIYGGLIHNPGYALRPGEFEQFGIHKVGEKLI